MAKKLEQKPKGEGIPTTAKVSSAHRLSWGRWGGSRLGKSLDPPMPEGAAGRAAGRRVAVSQATAPASTPRGYSGYRGILGAERHTCPDLGNRLQSPSFPPQAGVPTI